MDTRTYPKLCISWRYIGQRVLSGTRIDLCCAECGHRIAADPDTQRFHAAGARLLCQVCAPEPFRFPADF